MKKKIAIIGIVSIICVGFIIGWATFTLWALKPKNWASLELSVDPSSPGTYWETEGGYFSYKNHENPGMGTLADDPTVGVLCIDERSLEVELYFSSEDRTLWLYPHKDLPISAIVEHLEVWEAVDWSETDAQIIVDMKVIETTYFEEGQIIKLIHNKEQ